MATSVLGAIIAGGLSSRFGSPKALTRVDGRRVIDRVTDALYGVTPRVVAIVNDPTLAATFGLPHRGDVHAGAGPIAGLHAALAWAEEDGFDAALALACDLPFVPTSLLEMLCVTAAQTQADAILPESDGPRGMEPLCAWYSTRCLPAVRSALERGDHRLIGFHSAVHVARLPLDRVRECGDPALLFANLNTPMDRDRADRVARSGRE